jgi:hypothetical protein
VIGCILLYIIFVVLNQCVGMINIVTDDMTSALRSIVCICRYVLNLVFMSFICCMTVSISVDLWKVK